MPDYPEHDKLHAIKDKSQLIGEFLEWLQGKYTIAEYEGDLLWPVHVSIETLLADYFNIDLNALEREKEDILEAHRQGVR